MLSVNNLSYYIKDKAILENICFSIDAGEHLVILGANGAGKSTLLKLITAEAKSPYGKILFNGKSLGSYSARAMARLRAVMPQEVQLDFPFKAREVVAMGHAPHPAEERSASITDLCLKKMDISHLADRVYPSMSGGEKQRVQLARILCQIEQRPSSHTSRFLFLDECTSALDPAHQHQVFDQVSKIKQDQGISVLSIMHDLNLAAHYADKVLVLKSGQIIAMGTPEETLTREVLANAYAIDTQVLVHPSTHKPLVVSLGCLS